MIPVQELFAHAKAYQAEVEKKLEAKMPKFSRDYVLSVVEADGC